MAGELSKFRITLLDTLAVIVGILVSGALLWAAETRLFPVVRDFKITVVAKTDEGYAVAGTLDKVRSCELLGVSLFLVKGGEPSRLLTTYNKGWFGTDTATGHQTWGPWVIKTSDEIRGYEAVRVIAMHRCHFLWLQQTEYITFPVKGLPQ